LLSERPVVPVSPDESFGPLIVGFAIREGAPPQQQFVDELEREAIRLAPAAFPTGGTGEAAPDVSVVLVWLPAGVPASELADVAAWRERAAVVGCAPTGTNEDSERALAAGFDDFVAGRAAPREMARRLRAVERRTRRIAVRSGRRERFGRIRVDSDQHRLWVDGSRVALTRTELAVMTTLVDAAGQIRTRADILLKAWGDEGLEVGERAVDNIIMRLRRKLPDPDLIVTVRGVGFRLADG
jgi:DNA-binding response OmpR family regulator